MRPICSPIAVLGVAALALGAGPAPAAPALSEERSRALDALYTAHLPFDRDDVPRSAIGRVPATARAANRAVERTVPSARCRRAWRAPASELRPLERLVSALRPLERAIRTDSRADLQDADRRIAAFDRAARSGPSARAYRDRFRRACR